MFLTCFLEDYDLSLFFLNRSSNDGQLMFFLGIRTVKSILLVKNLLGLVQMTSGLVNASFSLPEWQAVKVIFFAPCFLQVN